MNMTWEGESYRSFVVRYSFVRLSSWSEENDNGRQKNNDGGKKEQNKGRAGKKIYVARSGFEI
jgi:hypothetical protein